MTTYLVTALMVSLVVFYFNYLWKRRRLYKLAANIPGPKGFPVIGMAHKFINASCKEMFDVLVNTPIGYPSVMKIWLGPELVIFASTPESLQIVLNSQKCIDKSTLYDRLVLTQGLVIVNGPMWKKHRKILNPSFRISVLQELIPTFDEKSRIFVKNLEAKVGNEQFNIFNYMSACSLETLLKGTMEIDRDIQSDPLKNDYLHNVEMSATIMMTKMFNVLYHFESIYRFTNLCKLERKYIHDGVLKVADEILKEHEDLEELEADQHQDFEDGFTIKKPRTFIKTLLKSKSVLRDQEIKDEINTLVAAGHETSALVTSNVLLMLAIHPEVQKRVAGELKEVFGSVDTPIDYESLNKLVYLEMVIKETMRLFPVLPISARKSSDEFQIDNYTIPTGATIIISAFSVQRSKRYWGEDADMFQPERFEPESFSKIHPYAFIPFTGGPRICIGWRYGMLFIKSVLANFLRAYEVETNLEYEELDYEMSLTMKILQRCMISLKFRDF